jgi:hypothetical protein
MALGRLVAALASFCALIGTTGLLVIIGLSLLVLL